MDTPKKYIVAVCRTAVDTKEYVVEADDPEKAKDMAYEQAANDNWDTYANQEYDIDSIEEHD